MNRISCEVVRDLLPLYYDKVCSGATEALVEEHVAGCDECKRLLEELDRSTSLPPQTIEANRQEGEELKGITVLWKKSKTAAFAKGAVLAVAVCAALYSGYLVLTQWNIVNVPAKVIEVSDISRLNDGKIVYRVWTTDGYAVNQINHKMDDSGNLYLIPVRPVIKSKKFAEISLGNIYNFVDLEQISTNRQAKGKGAEIRAVYYGSPEAPILIWKKGLVLPAANAAVEAQFRFD
ncbi:zf-HC2 domain-containing protein [Paenibacillus macerans]|uniref:zf-HC2 domain-containing protein n=1 Tax=Paenibacillus macerans TaxID=44252 RepID=UPI00203A703D|nr:zf-HC2 domain-containing protein [Paenibacillus macerans]MCM3703373.1 zf-HC2 domain-containing protein [Paenibacillus macerans]